MSSTSRIARYEDWRATRYFPGLEGLRAVAALLVVFHHARTHRLWGVLEGWNGVTLFFVLSGFLITTLALREEDEHGSLRWRAFVVRRGFRILPIYFASLALYAAVMYSVGFGGDHRSVFTHALPWYLSPFPEVPFFTKTHIVFSLAWSLGIEEKFYLLWPLVAFVLLRKHARGRIGLALVLALVAQLPIAFSSGGRALAPYSAILVGCLLAFALHHRHAFRFVARLGSVPGLVVALALLVTVQALTHVFDVTAAGFRVVVALLLPPVLVRSGARRRVARIAGARQRRLPLAPVALRRTHQLSALPDAPDRARLRRHGNRARRRRHRARLPRGRAGVVARARLRPASRDRAPADRCGQARRGAGVPAAARACAGPAARRLLARQTAETSLERGTILSEPCATPGSAVGVS